MTGIAASTKPERRGDHHHAARAGEQDEVTQRDRHRRADRGLDLRRVSGQPRDDLARLRAVEKGRRERDDVAEYLLAQIGDDALAEDRHEIEAQRARGGEHRDDEDQHREVAVDHPEALLGEAEIDHPPHRDRQRERGERGDDQRDQGADGVSGIAPDCRPQSQQRAQPRLRGRPPVDAEVGGGARAAAAAAGRQVRIAHRAQRPFVRGGGSGRLLVSAARVGYRARLHGTDTQAMGARQQARGDQ